MKNVLTVAVQSLHNDQARMDGISRNLANVSTPGYRRETFVARAFADMLAASAPQAQSAIDARPGSFKFTGAPLDVAIEGEGFFEVATASGTALTRQGRFQVDTRGRLVTEAGDAVMGTGGEITVTSPRPVIDRQGQVIDNGRVVGQLKTVRIAGTSRLERLGAGLLRAAGGPPPTEGSATLRQGHLETSNVSSMTEMVRLVDTMRHFEATQKLIQARDEMLEKALRKLGDL